MYGARVFTWRGMSPFNASIVRSQVHLLLTWAAGHVLYAMDRGLAAGYGLLAFLKTRSALMSPLLLLLHRVLRPAYPSISTAAGCFDCCCRSCGSALAANVSWVRRALQLWSLTTSFGTSSRTEVAQLWSRGTSFSTWSRT